MVTVNFWISPWAVVSVIFILILPTLYGVDQLQVTESTLPVSGLSFCGLTLKVVLSNSMVTTPSSFVWTLLSAARCSVFEAVRTVFFSHWPYPAVTAVSNMAATRSCFIFGFICLVNSYDAFR